MHSLHVKRVNVTSSFSIIRIKKLNVKQDSKFQTWASISWSVPVGPLSSSNFTSASSAQSFFKVLIATSSWLILSLRTPQNISGHFSCSTQTNSFWSNKRSLSSSSISVSALVIKILKTWIQDSMFKASSSITSTKLTLSQIKHNTRRTQNSQPEGVWNNDYQGHTQSRSHIHVAVTSNYYHSHLRKVNK